MTTSTKLRLRLLQLIVSYVLLFEAVRLYYLSTKPGFFGSSSTPFPAYLLLGVLPIVATILYVSLRRQRPESDLRESVPAMIFWWITFALSLISIFLNLLALIVFGSLL